MVLHRTSRVLLSFIVGLFLIPHVVRAKDRVVVQPPDKASPLIIAGGGVHSSGATAELTKLQEAYSIGLVHRDRTRGRQELVLP